MLKELALPGGRAVIPRTGVRWFLASLLFFVLLSAGAGLLLLVPPEYQVWFNGQRVGAGRDIGRLELLLGEELERQLLREIALGAKGQTWRFRLNELGMTLTPENAPGLVRQAVAEVPWPQKLLWSKPRVEIAQAPAWDQARLEAALAPLAAAVARSPVPAELQIVNRQPVITPEVPGAALDLPALKLALRSIGNGESHLEVPIRQELPGVTQASLEALRINRLITEWSTHYDPSIPRAENVEKAARAFDGLMLKPGEILSYNAAVGPINAQTGWKEAYVIVGGELVQGIGGGVCQVATTFYGAALRANLEIMERHQHQLAVTYIAPSQDAAIAKGWEDLKLRNNTPGHLLIETESGGGTVTFRLYGDVPEGQEVRIESRVLGTRPFEQKVVSDSTLKPGRQVVKVKGNPGINSEAYRLVYQNGQLVKREQLSRDNYLPTTQVVLTGQAPAVKPPAGPPKPPAQPPEPPADPKPVEPPVNPPDDPQPDDPNPGDPKPGDPGQTPEPDPGEPAPVPPTSGNGG